MTHPEAQFVQAVRPLHGLWRAEHSLQVGLEVHPLILEPVPPESLGVLTLLTDPHTIDELADLSPGLSKAWLEWLLAQLSEAGLVRPWRPQPLRQVVVWGAGPLAERIHSCLQRAELQPLPLGQRGWTGPSQPLIVLATGTLEPDRWLTDRIVAAGHSAVVVRAEVDRGVIGPFIQPRRTPCLRCLDLLHTELDPQWPRLLAQLCRTRSSPQPSLLEWLAGEAVAEVCRWRAGQLPDLAGRTLELSLPDFQRSSSTWPLHPDCTCQQRRPSERLGTLAG